MLRRSSFLALAGLALGAALAGCGGGSPGIAGPTSGVGALVITSAPAGFTRRTDSSAATGAVDLARAASTDGSGDARAALVSEGFRRGWSAVWTKEPDALVASQVYEFASAGGAMADRRRVAGALLATPGRVHHFAVAGIPEEAGGGVEVTVEGHTMTTVVASRGRRTLQLVCSAASTGSLQDRASTLAREQYDRLGEPGQ